MIDKNPKKQFNNIFPIYNNLQKRIPIKQIVTRDPKGLTSS